MIYKSYEITVECITACAVYDINDQGEPTTLDTPIDTELEPRFWGIADQYGDRLEWLNYDEYTLDEVKKLIDDGLEV